MSNVHFDKILMENPFNFLSQAVPEEDEDPAKSAIEEFWTSEMDSISTHNYGAKRDIKASRIKKVMKTDEDVKVLFGSLIFR